MSIINREDIIAKIISLTSPRDACRSMLVSNLFKSAADSDEVWETFLPSDYQDIICKSLLLTPSSLTFLSKKNLYFYFSHNPIVFDIDNLSFLIDKQTGKKCYMIGARGLSLHLSDNPENWEWISLPNFRFSEVVRLKGVTNNFTIEGRLDAKHLSPKTTYGAYLIYKTEGTRQGLEGNTVLFYIIVERRRYEIIFGNEFNRSQRRRDGSEEIKIGELYNDVGDEGDWVCRIEEDTNKIKSGIIVEGIEFRPKSYLLHHLDTDNMVTETDKQTGKKWCRIGARRLVLNWGNSPENWIWKSLPESRFSEVAELLTVWWLEICGRLDSILLSPGTTYGAYLVYKLNRNSGGFQGNYTDFCLSFERQRYQQNFKSSLEEASDRDDGWKEFEIGEFITRHDGDGEVVCRILHPTSPSKSGLILEGIEFRPKLA